MKGAKKINNDQSKRSLGPGNLLVNTSFNAKNQVRSKANPTSVINISPISGNSNSIDSSKIIENEMGAWEIKQQKPPRLRDSFSQYY